MRAWCTCVKRCMAAVAWMLQQAGEVRVDRRCWDMAARAPAAAAAAAAAAAPAAAPANPAEGTRAGSDPVGEGAAGAAGQQPPGRRLRWTQLLPLLGSRLQRHGQGPVRVLSEQAQMVADALAV